MPQSVPGLWKKVPKWVIDPEGPIFIRKRYLASFLPWALKFLQAGKVEKVEKNWRRHDGAQRSFSITLP